MNNLDTGIKYASNIPAGLSGENLYSFSETANVRRIHSLLKGYAPTELVSLSSLAAERGVRGIFVKDESTRFGLKAFKALGSAYAVFRVLCERAGLDPMTSSPDDLMTESVKSRLAGTEFITTTDGNHGKGVAWAANYFGYHSHVYMPKGTVEVRAEAIRAAGADDVTITDMGYDDCVRYTASLAEKNGWCLVQDTAGEDSTYKVPYYIMQGYTTLLYEAAAQLKEYGFERPTHLFLQVGVGAMAGAIAAAAISAFGDDLVISTVEPTDVACIYHSFAAGDGRPHAAPDPGETIMAGLNCAEPCAPAFEILHAAARMAIACGDGVTVHGMRLLAHPHGGDRAVISGESGAVTAGLTDLLLSDSSYSDIREALGLGKDSAILLISTEGDTDPTNYRRITTL